MSPNFPKDIPGKEMFKGPVFHSARWRYDIDLKAKSMLLLVMVVPRTF